jgi:hypothetical protein
MNTRIVVGLLLAGAFTITQAQAQEVSTQAAPASSAEESAARAGSVGSATPATSTGGVSDSGGSDVDGAHHDGGRVGRAEHAPRFASLNGHGARIAAHHSSGGHHGRR